MTEFLKSDKQLEQDLNRQGMSREELDTYLRSFRERAVSGEQSQPHGPDGRFVSPNSGNTERTFTRTVEIGGKPLTFESSSEAELDVMINSAQQAVERLTETAAPTDAEVEVARQKELIEQNQRDLDLQAGRISMKDYVEQSRTVESYLESQGIDINQLRDQSQERENANLVKSWEAATAEFLQISDWPGGNRNLAQMHTVLAALDLIDADDKLAALQQAYAYMKQQGTIFSREETEGASVNQMAKERFGKDYSALSPQELLQLWKEAQQDISGDASKSNAAFIEVFSRRK